MVKFSRWVSLAAGTLVMASTGLNYSFSIFAPAVKQRFGLSEMQIASVAFCVNLGGYFAIVSGYMYDKMFDRHNLGPRLVMWAGCLLFTAGYGGMYACAVGWLRATYSRILICALLCGHSTTYWDTAVLVTSVRNFPDDRGTVLGILKGFLGLSTSIYTSLYLTMFEPDAIAFLAFIASVPPTLNFIGSLFVNQVPREYHDQERTQYALAAAHVPPHIGPAPTARGPPPASPRGRMPRVSSSASGAVAVAEAAARVCMTKQARLMCVYCLVGLLAVFQMACALYARRHPMDEESRETATGVLLALLSTLLLLPVSAGPWATRSLRKRNGAAAGAAGAAGHAAGGAGSGVGSSSCRGDDEEAALLQPLLPPAQEVVTITTAGGGDPAAKQHHQHPHQPHASRGGPHGEGVAEGGEDGEEGDVSDAESDTAPVAELPPGRAVRTLTFWLLFAQFAVGVGSGLALLNNLGSINTALGGLPGGQVVHVSLFSVANASGRLLFGYASERTLHGSGLPRTYWQVVVSGLLALAMAALATNASTAGSLYPLSLLTGLAFGGHWSVLPAITSDLFGLANFAANYTVLQFAGAFGSYFLATWLVAHNYQEAARAHGGEVTCMGQDCYTPTWLVLAGLNCITLIGSTLLARRSSGTYKAILSTHRR